VSTSILKWSEGLSNRVSVITRIYMDSMRFAVFMAVSLITFFRILLVLFCVIVYSVSQEECEILRESVPYVKLYRCNPKHLYPKLNGYGDNGQRKVWTSCISAYCTSTAVAH